MKYFLIFVAIALVIIGLAVSYKFFIVIENVYQYETPGELKMDATGQTGDFIGGVVGTIFSLAGFIMLLLTVRQQNVSFYNERFETNFFELLRLHRDNVSELRKEIYQSENLLEFQGRKVVQSIVSDVLKCREEVGIFFRKMNEKDIYEAPYALKLKATFKYTNPQVDLIKLAKINIPYCIVFFGIDGEGRKILENLFSGKFKPKFYKPLLDYVSLKPQASNKEYYTKWLQIVNISDFRNRIAVGLGTLSKRRGQSFKEENYPPSILQKIDDLWYKNDFVKYYDGNQFRLGHYFRHLYQTVTFIDNDKKLDAKRKYFYLKTFRAQLSTHEQVLLFMNSLSFLGMVWELTPKYKRSSIDFVNQRRARKKMLLTKYQLIKNIPNSEIFGFKVLEFYPKIALETNESYLESYLADRKLMDG